MRLALKKVAGLRIPRKNNTPVDRRLSSLQSKTPNTERKEKKSKLRLTYITSDRHSVDLKVNYKPTDFRLGDICHSIGKPIIPGRRFSVFAQGETGPRA
jgi:hypothetical protein